MKKIALLFSIISVVSVLNACANKEAAVTQPTAAPAHQDYKGEVTSKK